MNFETIVRKCLILLTFAFSMNPIQSQTPSSSPIRAPYLWGIQFGSAGEEYSLNHVTDKNGNLFVCGKTTGDMSGKNAGQNDGFITKIDNSGKILWTRQFGTSADEDIQWSAIDKTGNIYITGSTTGMLAGKNSGKEDLFVVKYSSDGQLLWSRQTGTDSTDVGKGICTDSHGYLYITGQTKGKLGSVSYGKTDGFLIKMDSEGNQKFIQQFGSDADDFSNSVTTAGNRGIYVCGSTFGILGAESKGMMDVFTGLFSYEGKLLHFNQFGSDGFEIAMDIKTDSENNIYVGGSTSGNFGCQQIGEGDCFLTKLNSEGKILWTNQFGTHMHDGIRSIAFNGNHRDIVIISGLLNLPPAQAFVRIYKGTGELLWENNLTNQFKDCDASGKDADMDDSGNIYQLGLTGSSLFGKLTGEHDLFLVKLKTVKNILH